MEGYHSIGLARRCREISEVSDSNPQDYELSSAASQDNDGQEDNLQMGNELPWPFWYFDAYIRPWEYLHPRSLGLEMLMGITVYYGAICFVVGSFSDSSPWVRCVI